MNQTKLSTMLRTITLISILFCFDFLSFKLTAQDSVYEFIHANKVKTGMSNYGSFFENEDNNSGFIVPYEEGGEILSTLWEADVLISAADEHENIIGSFSSCYWDRRRTTGPLNADEINFDFNKVWKIMKTELDAFLFDLEDGQIDNIISANIIEWPGSGNPHYNGDLPIQELAPFHDANNDNIYNPLDGDFPTLGESLKTIKPDEFLFTIYHDTNSSSDCYSTKLEYQTFLYAFKSEDSNAVNHTIFVHQNITNRDTIDYYNLNYGTILYSGIGCGVDDFVGCTPETNSYYIYNKDNVDDIDSFNICSSLSFYGINPPVQSVLYLNHDLQSFVANPRWTAGGCEAESVCQNLDTYLNGQWRDGTPITVGGNGLNEWNPMNLDTTTFTYFGDPSDTTEWSMMTGDVSYCFETVSGINIGALESGESFTVDMAYIYTREPGANHLENIDYAKNDVSEIQDLYDNRFGFTSSIHGTKHKEIEKGVSIFPNPSTGSINILSPENIRQFNVIDHLGRTIQSGYVSERNQQITLNEHGVYFLQLLNQQSNIVETQKIIIL